jgi:4-hydroxybenzoyl-CoA thioesterase
VTFTTAFPVRFGDCDPAGIAYFPRLLALIDAAVEDWTAATLGADRRTLHLEQHLGLPAAKLETEFQSPARLGDRLDMSVGVERLGTSSLALVITGSINGQPCLVARLVLVLTDLSAMRPIPWPDTWRQELLPVAEQDSS